MKNVVIFANCQSGALGKTLEENKVFSENFTWIPLPPVQNIKSKEKIQQLLISVKNADVFIYQQVNGPKFPDEVNTKYLIKFLRPDVTKISFPSLYFNGYFPHLGTMDGLVGPLNLVHDYVIAFCYVKGLSEEKTKELINKSDLYPEELSKTATRKSIMSLRQREEEDNFDVRISSYIEKNYRKVKLFNQFNHPRRPVFEFLSKEILRKLGVEDLDLSSSEEYLASICTPIYPSTYKNLGLSFAEETNKYSGVGGTLSLEEIISKFYKLYKVRGRGQILAHVKKQKSFVIDLVERHV